ncbi:MAG: hypothetical protein ACE5EX_04375 [Phycisphaerae bacterium]
MDVKTDHYRIGVVHIGLRTSDRGVRRRYRRLYGAYETGEPSPRELRVEVHRAGGPPARPPAGRRPGWRRPGKRRRYEIRVNGPVFYEPGRRDEVLPYLDWAVNWELPRAMPEFLQLHASSLAVEGRGVIFPGHSGSGKSTLTAGLLTRGWHYLCDEFALIHTDTLMLHPYPRAICLTEPSIPVARSLGVPLGSPRGLLRRGTARVALLNPLAVRADAVGTPCGVRAVIFPQYRAGASPSIVPISRAQAAFALHRVCFNLLGCRRPSLDVMAAMIRGASCYRLTCGPIKATCDLVQQAVDEDARHQAKCA